MIAPSDISPPGVELSRLAEWLDQHRPGLRQGRLTATLIAGGKSNLTYRLTDDHSQWALRRPPLGHLLPTAHDMAREYRVIAALGPSEVPVAEAVALCTDPAILGEPFYLMSFVEGVVLESPATVTDRASATRASELLVDTLLALHRVDPAAVGLADFGRPDGFCERQVRRWHAQFLASLPGLESEAGAVDLAATELAVVQALGQRLPAGGPIGIVHGDYRLTNVMFTSDLQHIAAVVDWEMATLGDPLTDVGLLFVYHELAGATGAVMPAFPADRGFLNPNELVERYAAGSGQELPALDWYIAFGYFKLGVIAAGIHARYRQGKTVGAGFEQFGAVIDLALRGAQDRLGGM
ncbi:MAG: hypothetical protein QOE89_3549 [Pseudonocardiales bacterium]|nr:hypothetical protein [Pseudonocardiales bacterium]